MNVYWIFHKNGFGMYLVTLYSLDQMITQKILYQVSMFKLCELHNFLNLTGCNNWKVRRKIDVKIMRLRTKYSSTLHDSVRINIIPCQHEINGRCIFYQTNLWKTLANFSYVSFRLRDNEWYISYVFYRT